MVTKYGFSDNIGVINYDEDDNEVFIGRDLAHTRSHFTALHNSIICSATIHIITSRPATS